eukprot:6303230-Lingulodinium_polyedra.AAC.1
MLRFRSGSLPRLLQLPCMSWQVLFIDTHVKSLMQTAEHASTRAQLGMRRAAAAGRTSMTSQHGCTRGQHGA